MIEKFTATSISIEQQDGQMSLAVFNENDDYLFFQYPLEKKDWDNGVYIEFKNQRHGAFDVVSRIRISNENLKVKLTSPLFSLPDITGFDVVLDCQPISISELAEQLTLAYHGRSVQFHNQL